MEYASAVRLCHACIPRPQTSRYAATLMACADAADTLAAGHVKSMARDEWAHLVLMTALDRVDDTALLRKYIIAELLVRSPANRPRA